MEKTKNWERSKPGNIQIFMNVKQQPKQIKLEK